MLSQVRISNNDEFNNFLKIWQNTLDKLGPYIKKYFRGNTDLFINNTLSNQIMKRENLRTKHWKSWSEEDRQSYAKQINLCISLLRKTKRNYYSTLNEKNIIDYRKFWKPVKPMLSNKWKDYILLMTRR